VPDRELHLNLNILGAGAYGGAWRVPSGDPLAAFDVEHYRRIGVLAEAAKLDAVFLADGLAVGDDARFRPHYVFEPTIVLAAIATATERIGLIGTASTSYNDPYNLARRLATLDHLSHGRVGWNVVTTAGSRAARNFGLDAAPAHRERYERAAEFLDVALGLWDSFDTEALIGDPDRGELLDLDRVRPIDHVGRFFDVRGPLGVPPSPQGRPVIVQAGASEDGKELAARYAEVIFTVATALPEAQRFYAEIKRRASALGRNPDHVVVLPGICTVIGADEAEALQRRAELEELVHPELALGRLAELLGADRSEFVLDAELPEHLRAPDREAEASQSFRAATIALATREHLTVRQLLRRLGGGFGHRIVAGAPEQIADIIEQWFRERGADGFNVMPDVLPSGAEAFAEHVVPELRRRGLFRTEYAGSTLRDHLGLPPLHAGGRTLSTNASS
jgi:FMN-dependent oxidoreductase (nitrilotriacetate monooxygenase family)